MPEKSKYKEGDQVSFVIDGEKYVGTIEIVDAWGTFFAPDEVSYDIMVDDFRGSRCLIKHVGESGLTLL